MAPTHPVVASSLSAVRKRLVRTFAIHEPFLCVRLQHMHRGLHVTQQWRRAWLHACVKASNTYSTVDVWMQLQCLAFEGLLDLLQVGVPADSKYLIVVGAAGSTSLLRYLAAP